MNRGSTLNGGRIQDTRDLQSRSFLNGGVNIILNYLLEHGYSGSQITTQKLKSPSVKEFKSITHFLFKQLDPNYTEMRDDKASDEDIITMFRQLGYPTPISKSNIASAGTPHAWPHLVAALTWLIELLSYEEAVSSEVTRTEENDDTSDAYLRYYVSTSYNIYMKGDDDKHEEFKVEFQNGFEKKNKQIEEQTKMMEDRNATLSADIAVVQNRRAELPKLMDKKAAYETDCQKFDALIKSLEVHKSTLGQKTRERESEMSKLYVALNEITAEIASLRRKIENQEMKPEDVEIMMAERARIEENQKKASERRIEVKNKAWLCENKLRDAVQGVEYASSVYNSMAQDLQVVPATARNARGRDFSLVIDTNASSHDKFVVTDMSALMNNITSFKKEMEQITSKLRSDAEKKQESLDEIEQNKIDLEQKARGAKDKIERQEETYKLELDQLDGLISMHSKEMQEMEQRLIGARDSGAEEARAATAQRHALEIAATQEALRAEHEHTKTAIITAIETVALECAAHRELMSKRLTEIKSVHERELQAQMENQTKFLGDSVMPPVPPY